MKLAALIIAGLVAAFVVYRFMIIMLVGGAPRTPTGVGGAFLGAIGIGGPT